MTVKQAISVTVNGKQYKREVEPRLTLADFLRHEINLTGTHIGCEHGVCGACTILLNGLSTRSCLTFAVQANGQQVTTIEGLAAPDGTLSPLQQAMADNHGLQCGFCTPGMLMMARDILLRLSRPDAQTVRHQLSGQICRCTGYANIVRAVVAAGQELAGSD